LNSLQPVDDQMISERSSIQSGVEPNKRALIVIVAAANGVGLFPFLLFIDAVRYLVIYLVIVIAVAALTAWLTLRRLDTDATEEPSFGEWLLGAWSAVAYPSTLAPFALMVYGIAFGLGSLTRYLAGLAGFDLAINPSAWGYWASLLAAVLLLVAFCHEGAQDLFHNLYPREAGNRSAFHRLLGIPVRIAIAVLVSFVALGILLVLFEFYELPKSLFAIALFLLLFYTSFPLTRLGRLRPGRPQTEIAERLARLLEGAQYKVIRYPRTGKPEIDPLIQSIDMLVHDTDRAFAVEVKSGAAAAAVEWNEAAALRAASSVLRKEMARPRVAIQPVLVLVGASVAPSLQRFSKEEDVAVFHLADASTLQTNPAAVTSWFQHLGEPTPNLGAS
jgi:hypothetical protein